MFKRVLLCYDGTEVGRRALKRGAELAILVGAQAYVLSIIPTTVAVPRSLPAPPAMHASSTRRAATANCWMSPLNG